MTNRYSFCRSRSRAKARYGGLIFILLIRQSSEARYDGSHHTRTIERLAPLATMPGTIPTTLTIKTRFTTPKGARSASSDPRSQQARSVKIPLTHCTLPP
ncbi:hypothetical protein MUK42_02564 [Musa troglodytarum]|uniref:Uncharacterized protein n=1 Tax=Musa troglodytarum TaxID=320322 RepID=A0A9E7JE10_9LILI|nr:hypothetical protein MUK42_02564 [Musa troglodytarum]